MSAAATRAPASRVPGRGPARPARAGRRRRAAEAATAYLFLAPALVLMAVLGVYPVVYGFGLSFYRWNGLSPTKTFVGLGNLSLLFVEDPVLAPLMREATLHTVLVAVAVPALGVLIALPLAVLLNSLRRFQALLRTVFFLPYVTTGIAVYYAWRLLYEPSGAFNAVAGAFGMGSLQQPDGWLGSSATALPAVIWVVVWATAPLGILLYLTGLQTIDPALLEAARLDGAGRLTLLRRITWPLLLPITGIFVIVCLREALQGFQVFLLMTNGGPTGHTEVLGLEVYKLAFGGRGAPQYGAASALGWSLFLIGLLLSLICLRLFRSRT